MQAPAALQGALGGGLRTVGVDAAKQVLVQVHLVEAIVGLLPLGVELVLIARQAAGARTTGG